MTTTTTTTNVTMDTNNGSDDTPVVVLIVVGVVFAVVGVSLVAAGVYLKRRRKRKASEGVEHEDDVFGLGPAPVSEPKREVPIDTGMYELSRSNIAAPITPKYSDHAGNDIGNNKNECGEEMKAEGLPSIGKDTHLSTDNNSESPALEQNQNRLLPSTDQDMRHTTITNAPSKRQKDDVKREAGCYGNNLTDAQTISQDDVIHGEIVESSSLEWTKL